MKMKLKFKFKNSLKYKIGVGMIFKAENGINIKIVGYTGRYAGGDRILMGSGDTNWTPSYLYMMFNQGRYSYLKGADEDYEIPTEIQSEVQN